MSEFFSLKLVDILGVLISFSTLIIALLVYKKLIPSELKKRQLETVLSLIQHLNTYTFNMHTMTYTGLKFNSSNAFLQRNIFQYRALFENEEKAEQNRLHKIYLLNDNLHPFDLTKFIENPLMPSQIVPYLSVFISLSILQNNDQVNTQEKIIVITHNLESSLSEITGDKLYKGHAKALKCHDDFLCAIDDLILALKKWCVSNDLEGLNFRHLNSRMIQP